MLLVRINKISLLNEKCLKGRSIKTFNHNRKTKKKHLITCLSHSCLIDIYFRFLSKYLRQKSRVKEKVGKLKHQSQRELIKNLNQSEVIILKFKYNI